MAWIPTPFVCSSSLFCFIPARPPSTPFPYTTLFRSHPTLQTIWACQARKDVYVEKPCSHDMFEAKQVVAAAQKYNRLDRKSTRLNSSHTVISYAVFCLKKKKSAF